MTDQELLSLSEEDIKLRLITPAIVEKAGWSKENIRMEFPLTDGRVIILGKSHGVQQPKRLDYLLRLNAHQMIAVVEAKSARKDLTTGIQQAIEYAVALHLPFAYASNGKAFLEHDMLTGAERQFSMDEFPTSEQLKQRAIREKNLTPEQAEVMETPYYFDRFSHEPRYYQRNAIDLTLEAVAKGQNRILLVMATGTGKTYTAFQIIWRLRAAGLKKRVLYLADRNILIDQTMNQDFKPFQKIMTKVQDKTMDSSYEIHMALYQQLVSADPDTEDAFRQFQPDFFDLILVDECHRGSAKEESNWRKVLDYFSSATQIGMTATPKQDREADNIDYFGEPLYTYSLKQGIEDGFLAPYSVTKSLLNVDLTGYTPRRGETDLYGNEIPEDWYSRKDFGRDITIRLRSKIIAQRITEKLRQIGRMTKTIVFCTDTDEAEVMRMLLSDLNQDMMRRNPHYVMRITGDDPEGKKQLSNFIDPDMAYPTVVTTSELLSTGVDCKTVGLIVIDKEIGSMTEFKQIVGRGTRLLKDHGKWHFEILDFRNATDLFRDPAFDGDPLPSSGDDPHRDPERKPEVPDDVVIIDDDPKPKKKKLVVNGQEIRIQTEIVSVLGADGRTLETTNITDFTRRSIRNRYATLDDFLHRWTETDRKQAILDELADENVLIDAVRQANPTLEESDIFDVICHVAYGQKPLTRRERVNNVRKRNIFAKYGPECRAVLEALLDKYADQGILNMENPATLQLAPFSQIGTPVKIAKLFGGKAQFLQAVRELELELYKQAA
ncbi:MAG: DEAD/DEAH box helicase family protein [Paludibacteraceae bacterium]|nr:DEAD/DEAH box helicase family protein [Paludibacteraceae bacterium]